MPTITEVRAVPYDLPLHKPLRWGAGQEMTELEHMLVAITLDDGAVGLAEVNPRPTIYGETPESVAAVVRRYIAPALVGESLDSVDDIAQLSAAWHLLKNNNSARAGVDMALWSALSASRGTPLSALLGVADERVRVSYILGTGDTDVVLDEVARVYEVGVRVLKIKVGKDFAREANLIERIRDGFPDMDYYLDANETFTVDTAPRLLRDFKALGAWYCEEPLPVALLGERASLRRTSPLMVIGDDSCFTLKDLERELAFDTFDVLNIKPARTGFTTSMAMLRRVRRVEKYVMTGSQASSVLGCIHTLMLAGVPGVTEPSEGTYWLQVDDAGALPLADGYVSMAALEDAHAETRARLMATYLG
ncbi:MAG: enolase C-terminal domain-like protein [Chloroflexota bacterium]